MTGMISAMKKKNSGIPEDLVFIFEGILQKQRDQLGHPKFVGITCFQPEWDDEFCQAMDKYLTKEQRFKLYETQGGCNGTGADKARKVFAIDYAHIPLDERIDLFAKTFGRWKPV